MHADRRGAVVELALKPKASLAPHSNPNLAYFLVVEGGGFVQVGEERARVAAGDAVVWPPDLVHAAWTELTPMRAIVVEFAPGPGAAAPPLPAGGAVVVSAGPGDPAPAGSARADGELSPKPAALPPERTSPDREPW